MPRLENCGPSVDAFCRETGSGSSTHDICADCAQEFSFDFPTPDDRLKPDLEDPVGEDGWHLTDYHPPYSECDYRCELCGKKLTEEDD